MDKMNIQIPGCSVDIYDTEVQVLQAAAEMIASLPDGATVSIWPDLVGRQVLARAGKLVQHNLTVFTNGSFADYNLAHYLEPVIGNSRISVTEKLPQKIDIAFLGPRPTTLDVGVIQESTERRPYKIAKLIEEIGAEVGSEKANMNKQYDENSQAPVLVKDLISVTDRVVYVFKGDLCKDACVGVLENHLSIGGVIFKAAIASEKKVTAITDILSSSLLSQIQHPWRQPGFTWTDRSAKIALCQTAYKYQKRIADITLSDLQQDNIPMSADDLSKYIKHTQDDIQSRIITISQSFFPADMKLRVMLFSPHPDDDVISAGAAVASLAGQENIEFHVTYCVSGNVSVPDSFVQQKIDEFKVQVHDDGTGSDLLGDQVTYNAQPATAAGHIRQTAYVTHYNMTAQEATMRFSTGCSPKSKGMLREVEAQSGLDKVNFFRKLGNSAHFMRLPFYGSGFGRRSVPGGEDVKRCLKLIEEVQPHVIFLAGDLSDPHGTHGHCYTVIKEAFELHEKEAIERMSQEEINKMYSVYNTRVVKDELSVKDIYGLVQQHHLSYKLMYRGAWAEFNVEDSTFIIKFTPEEMKHKMVMINEHRSQMGEALYLGGDNRPFDERAKERNIDTANKLKKMGLIEDGYEGAECFVGCGILP